MKNLIFTLLLLCSTSFSFAQNIPAYVPTNGLVGWWPFNGNANDESGNGNNGVVNGATLTSDRFGDTNKAFNFDGINDFITISNILLNGGYQSYSISYWYNKTVPFSIITETVINDRISLTSGFKYVSNSINSGNLQFAAASQNISNQISSISNITPLVHTNNNWFNIVFTLNASNNSAKIYVNGILDDSTQFNPNNWPTNAASTHIGAAPLAISDEQWFNGKIDDIGIWNRALTPQEVSNLYTSSVCANNLSISPTQNSVQRGNTATFTATTSDPNPTIIWQSDFGQGFQTLNNVGNYTGTNTATLNISNVQLNNHNQPVRAISSSGNCVDTSAVSVINVQDTCVNTVFDTVTTFISVTDTLIINAVISSVNPPNNVNTLLIYPNPANTHITIDNGNFASMAGYSVRINNALGQVVFNQNITQQQFFIDLSTWTGPGLYYVNILDPNGNPIEVKKIVIQ